MRALRGGELARMREAEVEQSLEVRARIMEAMLAVSGEKGYGEVAVQDVIDRYGGYRLQFYRHFANKADCYSAAYDAEIERLCGHILEASRTAQNWDASLRASLDVLARFVCERPQVARGLVVEVHVAGAPALSKRAEVLKRLSRAIDSARRENGSRHSPPPITASFMIGAVESAVTSALLRNEPHYFSDVVPELAQMVIAAYFGDQAAGQPEPAALPAT